MAAQRPTTSFDSKTHIYRIAGRVVPGVTGVLKGVGILNFDHIPADRREASLKFGTAVHRTCELFDKRDLDEMLISPLIVPHLEGWKKFVSETGIKFIFNEEQCYSIKYGYGCTPDRVGVLYGRITVVEIKTSVSAQKGTDLQLAGNLVAYNEVRARADQALDRIAVHLNNTGAYKIEPYKDRNDINTFLTCLSFHNILQRRNLCK